MEKANQRAETSTRMLMKYMLMAWIPSSPMIATTTLIYSLIKFGFVNFDILYRPFVLMYTISPIVEETTTIYIFFFPIDYHGTSKPFTVG